MKQVQYRRAAQSTGFRPVQISGNEIARMREESARVVQGMRDVRDAEIRERERQLADEKQAQQLEAKQIQRNRQIQTAAHQNTITGLQEEARVKQAQYQQDLEDNTKILQGISTLSQSADKAYTQYVEAEEDKTIAQELEDYLNNPNDAILTSLRSELGLDVLDEMEQSKLDEYVAAGGDPLVAAKGRNYSNRVRREILKGKAAYFYQYKYSQLLDEAIRAEEDRLGRKMLSAELAGYMTEVGGIVAERFRNQGGMTLKPGSMRTALEYREKIHMNRLSTARSQEIENELKQTADNATSILTNNPADFEQNIVSSFQMYRRAKGNDYAAAHDWYESLYTMRGPDGKYLFTEEQLAGTVLMAGEKAYALQRPGRHAAGLRARMIDDTKYRKEQITAENVAFKEAEQNSLEQLTSNPTKETADAIVGYFRDTYGRVPETITKFQENYTVEAESKAKQIEQLEAIPDGFIRKEHVDALKRLDVKSGNELEKRRAAQEAKYNSGIYKEQSDAFKTAANGVTSFGSQKPNNASSLFLQQEMRFRYIVEYVIIFF